MQVNVRFLDNLRLEASFDDYSIISDQPVRYKGDATAPGPFDYFLASSALCAAYFVKLYCSTRDIPTEDIKLTQQNIVNPDNRYHQDLNIQIELPDSIDDKDRKGIIASMQRCTVKRVIQNSPNFKIEALGPQEGEVNLDYTSYGPKDFKTQLKGKDCTLEETITNMRSLLADLGIKIEIASWRNPLPHVWSVHLRDADSPMCYTNGKGSTKDAALCSALGEYLERISNNYFYNDFYLGESIAQASFVHYPQEKWFPVENSRELPLGMMDDHFLEIYNPESELLPEHLIDTNSGNKDRGICCLPFIRQSDKERIYVPVNLIGNLFVSNGMSAGNTLFEARVQALSEIFERAVKNQIILEELTLPDVPEDILKLYPSILEGIEGLREKGFPVIIKDASLGGRFPVIAVTLMNPKNGGVFASFGSHPDFEVALERALTELLQGRSFEGLNDTAPPTFNSFAIREHNNIVDHFIDSTGVISWKFFSAKPQFSFKHWNFKGTTEQEFNYLMEILSSLEKEVYIADYEDLGTPACRIIIPGYSEIYPVEELVWDNHNKALLYRTDILNLHSLSDQGLKKLCQNLEESELDDYTLISELIGVAFDEADAWGRLTIGELKGLIYLALQDFEEAKNQVDMFVAFNDSTPKRRTFYQILSALIEIELDQSLDHKDYTASLTLMYGEELLKEASMTLQNNNRFPGLIPTDENLKGLDKHLALIESYRKLHSKRANP